MMNFILIGLIGLSGGVLCLMFWSQEILIKAQEEEYELQVRLIENLEKGQLAFKSVSDSYFEMILDIKKCLLLGVDAGFVVTKIEDLERTCFEIDRKHNLTKTEREN